MFDPRTSRWNSALHYPSTYEEDVENPPRARLDALEEAIAGLGGGSIIDDTDETATDTTLSAAAIIAAINDALNNLVDAAPGTLNTLNELAAALGDDPNFATTITTALAGKANTSHTHTIANVTNLQTTLDGKAATGHTHTIANITNLQTTLDGKAATAHTHVAADITDFQAAVEAVVNAMPPA